MYKRQGAVVAIDEPGKIGEFLKKDNNEMFAAMPSPVQIYYGVENDLGCPLTVREGRNWLTQLFAEKEIKTPMIQRPEDEEFIGTPAIFMKEVWFRYEKEAPDVLKGVNPVSYTHLANLAADL